MGTPKMEKFAAAFEKGTLILAILASTLLNPLWGQSPLSLPKEANLLDLSPYISLQQEANISFGADSLPLSPSFKVFEPEKTLEANHIYWGILEIENPHEAPSTWVFFPDWETEPEHNGFIEVFLKYPDSTLRKKAGRYIPASQKEIPNGPGNKVYIHLAGKQRVQVFFRFEKYNHASPLLQPRLASETYWKSLNQEVRNVRIGIVQGMLWMMILYTFTIFLGTRESTYLIYALFLLASSLYFLYLSGVMLEVIFRESPKVNPYIRIVVSNILPWAFFQFSRSFLDTPTLIPTWDKAVKYLLRFIILIMIVELIIVSIWFHEPILNVLVDVAFLIEGIFILIVVLRFLFTPNVLGRIFILGAACMAIAAFVGVSADIWATVQEYLPAIEAAFVAQVLTFALGLAFRLRMGEREKLEAQKTLNEQLVHMDQLKDTFLANTSHELRTPLHGILGLSEGLYEQAEEVQPQRIRSDLNMIITSARRLTHLVNDLLDFSKLKTRNLTLNRKPVDLRSIIEVVMYSHKPMLKGKKLVLNNNLAPDSPSVWGDEDRLQQIFFNLVHNAVKFTEKGEITANAKVENDQLLIAVSDTGVGIPKDKLEQIFLEFEQADGSIARQYAGSGLGLSISKYLTELHDGKIWAESELGVGSTFFVSLPLAKEQAHSGPQVQLTPLVQWAPISSETTLPDLSNGQERDLRILLVDDEVVNHQVLRNHLRDSNYSVVSAMNGIEALKHIHEGPSFDLVILDLMMPQMSGYEVCEKIRASFLPSELPVIMVTAKNQVRDMVEGLAKGANDYLAKPFGKEEFLARVKTQLHLHRINRITGRFVPKEFIASLGLESMLDLHLGDHVAQTVTVYFCDIRGYTSLAEKMTPDENFKFVNAFVGRLGPLIKENQGFVHQYLGDSIMAIFPNHAGHGLKASIAMQQAIRTYNQQRIQQGRQPLRVGMGMHTGELIMGIIGDQYRTEAATISDTVNTASRMEGLTKFFGCSILFSETSMQQIQSEQAYENLHFRFLGKVQVKGRATALRVYECLEGEDETQFELKKATLATFHQALESYFEQDFVAAVGGFKSVLQQNAEDKSAHHYLVKASKYVVESVPEGWNGVEAMSSK